MPGNVSDCQAVTTFLQNASLTFSPKDESGNHLLDQDLTFLVAYSTLEGRRIKTRCLIRFNLGVNSLQAQIVPVSSWLGTESA